MSSKSHQYALFASDQSSLPRLHASASGWCLQINASHLVQLSTPCAQVTPPAICLQILSLPPHVHPFLNRVTVQAELLRAAANPPANGGALAHMQNNAPPVLNSQASMPIMLGSLMRHNSVASFRSSQKSPEAGAEGSSAVDALSAVWAQPVRGTYSRFFGQTGLAEEPILAPAPGDAPGGALPFHPLNVVATQRRGLV